MAWDQCQKRSKRVKSNIFDTTLLCLTQVTATKGKSAAQDFREISCPASNNRIVLFLFIVVNQQVPDDDQDQRDEISDRPAIENIREIGLET